MDDKKRLVMILSDGDPNQIETWVGRMARASMQPMDWNYQGGRAMIWTTGDLIWADRAASMLENEINTILGKDTSLFERIHHRHTMNLRDIELDREWAQKNYDWDYNKDYLQDQTLGFLTRLQPTDFEIHPIVRELCNPK